GRPGVMPLRLFALGVAAVHAASAPWAFELEPTGQHLYLLALLVPGFVLAVSELAAVPWRAIRWGRGAVPAAVILVWVVARLLGDVYSPRAADTVDGWQGFVALLRFVPPTTNVLTELMDPGLPGLGAVPLVFDGLPLFRAGVVAPSFQVVQVLKIVWL